MSNMTDHNNNSRVSESKKIMKNASTKLSSSTSDAGGAASKNERCVLCLDEKRFPVRITCGHSFCHECLEVYKSYQKYAWANRCPICRGMLKEKRRPVKRKSSEMEGVSASNSATTASSSSHNTAARTRLNTTSATIAAATAAAATVTATALSETAAEASAEQIYWLEEFMAIAADSNIFGTGSASATTPTNSTSTVSASEAAGEDEDEGERQETEGDDFVSEMGEEEALEEDYEDFEDDDEDGDDDDDDDESNDLYFFDEYDDENEDYQENDDYDTVDEDNAGDNGDETVEYYEEDFDLGEDVLLVDEDIIVD